MKNGQLCIASQTIQQLRNFRDSIIKLPLNSECKLYYSNLFSQYELRIKNENLQLDMLKIQIIAKLHQDILTQSSFSQYTTQIASEAENRLISIYETLSQSMPQTEENIHKKIIVSVMNFKFHLTKGAKSRLSLQQLLVTVQEMNLWQSFTQSNKSYLKYFYLCLMWQYIDHQDLLTFMEILSLYANFLVKNIQVLQKQSAKVESKQAQERLIDLLHCYNSFKLFKKQFNLQCTLIDQSQIYSVLYELEYSLSQKIIYQYKKLNSKSKDEIIRIIKGKLQENIITFDQKSIDSHLNLLNEQKKHKLSKQHLSLNLFQIRRKSSHDLLSETIKKRDILNLKPVNNVFVPRRINPNLQLERRLDLKKQRKSSQEKIENSTNNIFRRNKNRSEGKLNQSKMRKEEKKLTIAANLRQKTNQKSSKKLFQRPSYQTCKKNSTNKYEQLQMMICGRNRGTSLKINPKGEDIQMHLLPAQKSKSNKKWRMPFRQDSIASNNVNMNQKRTTWLQLDGKTGQIYPPFVRSALNQYIKSFTTYFKYKYVKYTLPLYLYFQNINKSSLFYLRGDIIRFVKIETEDLIMRIVYIKNQREVRTIKFKLYKFDQQNIRKIFVSKIAEKKLSGFYKLGGNMTYFSFNLKSNVSVLPSKLQMPKISYEQQIYSYNVYLTNAVDKNHYKKILKQTERFIKKLDQDLNIQFQYDKVVNNQRFQKKLTKNEVTLKDLLNAHYQKDVYQWHNIHSLKLSLKIKKKYNIFHIKHLENLQTSKKYLFFSFKNTAKLSTGFCIIPCSQNMSLKGFIYKADSWEDIKTRIIKQKHIIQSSWIDLLLNRRLFEFNSKKYVIAKYPKGFEVIKSQALLQRVLNLVKGQSGKTKWFLLLNLSDFQGIAIPSNTSNKSTNKLLKPPRNRSFYNTTSCVSIRTRNNMHSFKQNLDKALYSPIKMIKKEGSVITLGKQSFKCINYEYSWYLFLKQKIYYCFKMQNKVLSLRIKNSRFIYIRNHIISQKDQNKQLVFKQFRRLLLIQLSQKWIVFGLMGIVGVAQIVNNSVVVFIEQIQGKYKVNITATELYGLTSIQLNHSIFDNKQMMKRITRVLKYKLNQKMIFRL